MTSSSSSPSAPAFSSQSSYHVFLSFRGEDTRNNFVGHLYSALKQKGIQTYKDDKTLRQGETIGPALMKGINESQIALVVFSDNYADSSWCLDELVYIMNCNKTRGKIVIPVFYKVDPSDVRKQKRKFGEAFEKHESKSETMIDSWREALKAVGNISGFHYENPATRDESEFIKDIVKEVLKRLHPLNSGVDTNLIGVEERMEELKSKLKIGSGGVGMIGIWGVGGGGKTTLAYSVYKEVCREFEGSCFIENVGEKSRKNGLPKLQEELLSGVLNKQVSVGGVEEGKQMIRDRLCTRKVLIVLDDVDHHDQLEALAESVDWFGKGSQVIITTRDVHLLQASGVVVHNMSLLNDDEAIKLFVKHAFKNYRHIEDFEQLSEEEDFEQLSEEEDFEQLSEEEDFEQLSEEAVSYAGGLPLALKVFGRLLCGKNMHEWKSALARLKEIPNGEILKKLKISYDGLDQDQKDLFLDIACFYRGKYKEEAMEILDACGFHPVIGVKVLIEKALLTISDAGEFDMHDLIQEMAHYIVRGNNKKNPEKQSRIWEVEDVVNICAMDPTTVRVKELDMIEAIQYKFYDRYCDNPLKDLPPIVANTKNLRWIHWQGDLASPLLTYFPPRKLCYLKLMCSSQKQLWEGRKYLPNLKILDLVGLKNLITTPDFSGLPNLEIFKLHWCHNLEEVHSSLGDLKRLVTLSVELCTGIKVFPSITRLTNLKTLSFNNSPPLFGLLKIQQNMSNLPDLPLDDIGGTQVKQPGFALKRKKEKTDADECCLEEPCLPQNNMNKHIRLWFPLRNLTKLNLSACNLGDEDISSSKWELPNLQELNLDSNEFSRLDFCLLRVPKLKWLNVSGCGNLVALSNLPSSIAVVLAHLCPLLETFGDTSRCKWLWKVSHDHRCKVDPFSGGKLLDSMLQGNAIEDHFISVRLPHQIPMGFVGRLFRGKAFTNRPPLWDSNTTYGCDMFTLRLPLNWYNDFCGFLICVVSKESSMHIDIIIKQEADEDSGFEIWQESDEAPEPEYFDGGVMTHVGYVSFNSLRRTTFLTSSYNIISFYMASYNWTSFTAELVPRKSKDDPVQTTQVTTDSSEFWNKEGYVIKQDSMSSINISWNA